MTILIKSTAIALTLSLMTPAARACNDETDPAMFEALQVAAIKRSAGRVYFHEPTCDAGAKGLEACRRKAYVMPGDVVLIGGVYDTTACATFVDKEGRATSGIIKGDAVEHVASSDDKRAASLVGHWVREEAEIEIASRGQEYSVLGEATYGARDPNRVARGAVNLGRIDFRARPTTSRISAGLKDGKVAVPKAEAQSSDCQLDMIALGPYLVVKDNMQCGGMNVSFTGVYRRK